MPGNYSNPNAPAVLSNVRTLVDNGDYTAASTAALGLSGLPSDVQNPLTLFLSVFTDYCVSLSILDQHCTNLLNEKEK